MNTVTNTKMGATERCSERKELTHRDRRPLDTLSRWKITDGNPKEGKLGTKPSSNAEKAPQHSNQGNLVQDKLYQQGKANSQTGLFEWKSNSSTTCGGLRSLIAVYIWDGSLRV